MTNVKVFSSYAGPITAGDKLTEAFEEWKLKIKAETNQWIKISETNLAANPSGWMLAITYELRNMV